jgi:hypothetical protein
LQVTTGGQLQVTTGAEQVATAHELMYSPLQVQQSPRK